MTQLELNHTVKPPQSLAPALRLLGVLGVIVGGAAFLVEGWIRDEFILRHLMFLAFTAALLLAAFFVLFRAKDSLGSRVLFALSVLTIPAHFAQLGAEALALTREGALMGASALVLGAGSLILLIPAAIFGLSALARSHGRVLAGLLLAGSCTLLPPTRNPSLVAAAAAALFTLLAAVELLVLGRATRLGTIEARIARGMVWLPLLVLLARNLAYPSSHWLTATAVGLPSLGLLLLGRSLVENGDGRAVLEWTGFLGVAWAVLGLTNTAWASAAAISATMLLLSPALSLGARRTRAFGLPIAFVAVVLSLFQRSGMSLTVCLLLPAVYLAAGYATHDRNLFRRSAAAFVFALAAELSVWVEIPAAHRWWIPALAGIVLLLLASHAEGLERFWARRIRSRFE